MRSELEEGAGIPKPVAKPPARSSIAAAPVITVPAGEGAEADSADEDRQRELPPRAALIIKQPWLDRIISGEKTIEIRRTANRKYAGQPVYLSESGTGRVLAIAVFEASRSLTDEERALNAEALAYMNYPKPLAWPISRVRALPEPWMMPSEARESCVIWIPRDRWELFATPGGDARPAAKAAARPKRIAAAKVVPRAKGKGKAKALARAAASGSAADAMEARIDVASLSGSRAGGSQAASDFCGSQASSTFGAGGRGRSAGVDAAVALLQTVSIEQARDRLKSMGCSRSRAAQLLKEARLRMSREAAAASPTGVTAGVQGDASQRGSRAGGSQAGSDFAGSQASSVFGLGGRGRSAGVDAAVALLQTAGVDQARAQLKAMGCSSSRAAQLLKEARSRVQIPQRPTMKRPAARQGDVPRAADRRAAAKVTGRGALGCKTWTMAILILFA